MFDFFLSFRLYIFVHIFISSNTHSNSSLPLYAYRYTLYELCHIVYTWYLLFLLLWQCCYNYGSIHLSTIANWPSDICTVIDFSFFFIFVLRFPCSVLRFLPTNYSFCNIFFIYIIHKSQLIVWFSRDFSFVYITTSDCIWLNSLETDTQKQNLILSGMSEKPPFIV